MKKIMFNDKYGLTQAVLEGRKTMTRRMIKTPKKMEGKDVYGFAVVKRPGSNEVIEVFATDADGAQINNILPTYHPGEIVAVAQNYKDAGVDPSVEQEGSFQPTVGDSAGWNNKMFVQAWLMPNRIRITNVRVERLQDISDEDCVKEGVWEAQQVNYTSIDGIPFSPCEAFAALIDKVSGKGTWQANPYCFCYTFELIR